MTFQRQRDGPTFDLPHQVPGEKVAILKRWFRQAGGSLFQGKVLEAAPLRPVALCFSAAPGVTFRPPARGKPANDPLPIRFGPIFRLRSGFRPGTEEDSPPALPYFPGSMAAVTWLKCRDDRPFPWRTDWLAAHRSSLAGRGVPPLPTAFLEGQIFLRFLFARTEAMRLRTIPPPASDLTHFPHLCQTGTFALHAPPALPFPQWRTRGEADPVPVPDPLWAPDRIWFADVLLALVLPPWLTLPFAEDAPPAERPARRRGAPPARAWVPQTVPPRGMVLRGWEVRPLDVSRPAAARERLPALHLATGPVRTAPIPARTAPIPARPPFPLHRGRAGFPFSQGLTFAPAPLAGGEGRLAAQAPRRERPVLVSRPRHGFDPLQKETPSPLSGFPEALGPGPFPRTLRTLRLRAWFLVEKNPFRLRFDPGVMVLPPSPAVIPPMKPPTLPPVSPPTDGFTRAREGSFQPVSRPLRLSPRTDGADFRPGKNGELMRWVPDPARHARSRRMEEPFLPAAPHRHRIRSVDTTVQGGFQGFRNWPVRIRFEAKPFRDPFDIWLIDEPFQMLAFQAHSAREPGVTGAGLPAPTSPAAGWRILCGPISVPDAPRRVLRLLGTFRLPPGTPLIKRVLALRQYAAWEEPLLDAFLGSPLRAPRRLAFPPAVLRPIGSSSGIAPLKSAWEEAGRPDGGRLGSPRFRLLPLAFSDAGPPFPPRAFPRGLLGMRIREGQAWGPLRIRPILPRIGRGPEGDVREFGLHLPPFPFGFPAFGPARDSPSLLVPRPRFLPVSGEPRPVERAAFSLVPRPSPWRRSGGLRFPRRWSHPGRTAHLLPLVLGFRDDLGGYLPILRTIPQPDREPWPTGWTAASRASGLSARLKDPPEGVSLPPAPWRALLVGRFSPPSAETASTSWFPPVAALLRPPRSVFARPHPSVVLAPPARPAALPLPPPTFSLAFLPDVEEPVACWEFLVPRLPEGVPAARTDRHPAFLVLDTEVPQIHPAAKLWSMPFRQDFSLLPTSTTFGARFRSLRFPYRPEIRPVPEKTQGTWIDPLEEPTDITDSLGVSAFALQVLPRDRLSGSGIIGSLLTRSPTRAPDLSTLSPFVAGRLGYGTRPLIPPAGMRRLVRPEYRPPQVSARPRSPAPETAPVPGFAPGQTPPHREPLAGVSGTRTERALSVGRRDRPETVFPIDGRKASPRLSVRESPGASPRRMHQAAPHYVIAIPGRQRLPAPYGRPSREIAAGTAVPLLLAGGPPTRDDHLAVRGIESHVPFHFTPRRAILPLVEKEERRTVAEGSFSFPTGRWERALVAVPRGGPPHPYPLPGTGGGEGIRALDRVGGGEGIGALDRVGGGEGIGALAFLQGERDFRLFPPRDGGREEKLCLPADLPLPDAQRMTIDEPAAMHPPPRFVVSSTRVREQVREVFLPEWIDLPFPPRTPQTPILSP